MVLAHVHGPFAEGLLGKYLVDFFWPSKFLGYRRWADVVFQHPLDDASAWCVRALVHVRDVCMAVAWCAGDR